MDMALINQVFVGGNVLNDIKTTDGNINELQVTGSLLGDIVVKKGGGANGNINILEVFGDIGSPTQTVLIDVEQVIQDMDADRIWANIRTGGLLWRCEATVGDINGSIKAEGLGGPAPFNQRGIIAAGDLNASVILTNNATRQIAVGGDVTDDILIGGSLSSSEGEIDITGKLQADIRLGDSLSSPITIGANGLEGQIIINAKNDTGTWTGDVAIGATLLSPEPEYDETGFGGGAVGEVAYGFHAQECVPENGETTDAIPTAGVSVVHYGPIVSRCDLGGAPATVEYRDHPSGVDWTDVTDDFDFSCSDREMLVTPKSGVSWLLNKEYRILPQSGLLVIPGSKLDVDPDDGQTPDDVDVKAYTYSFIHVPPPGSP